MTMNQKELLQKFMDFSRIIIEELKRRDKKDINSFLEKYEVFVPDLRKLHLRDGKVDYILESMKIKKNYIDFEFDILPFFNDFCVKLPEYEKIQNLLKEIYQIREGQCEYIIKSFTFNLIYKYSQKLDEIEFNKFITKFIQKLNSKEVYVKTKIFLDGIWLAKGQILINENLKIRRIKPKDFESVSQDVLSQKIRSFGDFPYTVLKYNIALNKDFNNLADLQIFVLKEIRIMIYAFSLFKFGSVFSRECIIPIFKSTSPDVIFQAVSGFGYSSCKVDFTKGNIKHINPHLHIKTRHIYTISETDVKGLNEFIGVFKSVKLKETILTDSKNPNYISIALNRYQNAFLNVENIESQISYAISCLEALFSMKGSDLKRKLSQRISIIFKILGFNPVVIYKIVRDAYDVRSDYSHGEIVKFEDKTRLSKKIMQCARILLLIFIQIDTTLSNKETVIKLLKYKNLKEKKEKTVIRNRKQYFLDAVDYTLIDNHTYLKLNKFITRHCKLYP